MATIVNINDALPSVDGKQASDNNKNISQEDLMKQLAAIIILLQQVQRILNDGTTDDLERLATQCKTMQEEAQVEFNANKTEAENAIQQLQKEAHENIFKKIFGYIAAVVSIIIGTVMAVGSVLTGGASAGFGVVLVAMGVLALASTADPDGVAKFFDDISSIFGDVPILKAIIKTVLVVGLTVVAGLFGGPAGALMMFGSLWGIVNPTEDFSAVYYQQQGEDTQTAEDDGKSCLFTTIFNTATGIICMIGGFGCGFVGADKPAPIIKKAAAALKKFITGATDEIEMADIASSSVSNILENDPINLTDESSQNPTIKELGRRLKTSFIDRGILPRIIAAIAEFVPLSLQGVYNILVGDANLDYAKATEELGKIRAQAQLTKNINETITDMIKLADAYLGSLQQSFESNNATINKVFIDQVQIAQMMAKMA